MNWETVLCFGDSITIGSRYYIGYPEYCGNFLSHHTNKHWNVINHSVAGFTTIDLARSIDKNLSNLKICKADLATILIGTNDLKSNISVELFKIAYEQLVLKVCLLIGNNNIILIKIPYLTEGVMLPYRIGMNKTIDQYNKVISDIAVENNLILLEIDTQVLDFFDGIHLNETGSKSWGNQIANKILQLRQN